MPDEEIIASVDDLEDENTEAKESEEEADDKEANLEEVQKDSSEKEEDSSGSSDGDESEEGEYSEEELQEVLELGKKVKDYQASHPGFDPILLHKDYTQKTMELSELRKKFESQPAQPKEQEEKIDLSDVNPKDVEIVKRILKSEGYVHRSDVEKMRQDDKRQTYEQVKKQEISKFLEENPEYHPANDPGDKNWDVLLSEFSLFKLPEDPQKIGVLLKRAHKAISGSPGFDVKKASKLLAQKKVNKVGQATGSGKSGGAGAEKKGKIPEFAKENLKGFTDEELKEMFN